MTIESVIFNKVQLNNSILDELIQRYIAFDIETSGLKPSTDRIIEISAVLFEDGEIKEKYCSFINAGCVISERAASVNKITNEILEYAPNEETVYSELIRFLGNSMQGETILVAHNASFDMSFFKETLNRLGYEGTIRYLDTLSLSRKILKTVPNHKLETIAEFFKIETKMLHRAEYDAEICGRILNELLKLYKDHPFENKREALREKYAAKYPLAEKTKPEKITTGVSSPSVSGSKKHNKKRKYTPIPPKQIYHANNPMLGVCYGSPHWEKGEALRKAGRIHEAIQSFDKAREYGYLDSVLYESYVLAFHALGDYENELAILDEGISRLSKAGKKAGRLELRREKVVQFLSLK